MKVDVLLRRRRRGAVPHARLLRGAHLAVALRYAHVRDDGGVVAEQPHVRVERITQKTRDGVRTEMECAVRKLMGAHEQAGP